jgi:hypothetical protein
MFKSRQFWLLPLLSGCPFCQVTVWLESSAVLFGEHHWKLPDQLGNCDRRPEVQKRFSPFQVAAFYFKN